MLYLYNVKALSLSPLLKKNCHSGKKAEISKKLKEKAGKLTKVT